MLYTGIVIPFVIFVIFIYVQQNNFEIIGDNYFLILAGVGFILSIIFILIPLFQSNPINSETFLGSKIDRIVFTIGIVMIFLSLSMTLMVNVIIYITLFLPGVLLFAAPFLRAYSQIKKIKS